MLRKKIRLTADKKIRVAGLMSGTSADGIDVAIVDIAGDRVRLLAFGMVPYRTAIRRKIFDLFNPATARVDEICRMNFVLGELFAQALLEIARKNRIPPASIHLIGSHGQTIYHLPDENVPSTLQIGEPSVIAERTGITTVADFRPRDMAAGGQGAPLVPLADYILFHDRRKNRALQNIGGIANVTYLPAGGAIDDILAFDTGPGNMIVDRVTALITHGRKTFDEGGKLSARGRVHESLLAELMRHRYFRRLPPKTTGRELFGVQFTDDLYRQSIQKKISPPDLLATVTAFTARSIADAYKRFLPGPIDELILCGGGSWNKTLSAMLQSELPGVKFLSMNDFGIDPDAKEAVSFALLAYATIHGTAGNVPSATGARKPVVLGKIIPGR